MIETGIIYTTTESSAENMVLFIKECSGMQIVISNDCVGGVGNYKIEI